MSWENRVVWSEGLFLRPQHFQQHDRYVERFVRSRVAEIAAYPWGLASLRINQDLLDTGKFAVVDARGVFPDGTPFSIPEDTDHPEPLALNEEARNATVYLGIPERQAGGDETTEAVEDQSTARYCLDEFEARDTIARSATTAVLPVGKLRARYLLETDQRAGYTCIGVARVIEVRPDKRILLDDEYIPPVLDSRVSSQLDGYMTELIGLCNQRAEAIAARATQGSGQGVGEIANFLMLQMLNRVQPVLRHYASARPIHPERLYAFILEIAGEISTFTRPNKRPADFPAYQHDDLKATYKPVMQEIRAAFATVLEQPAVEIPLTHRGHGYYLAVISDPRLLTSATFVLTVRANIPTEQIRRDMPARVTIGAAEQVQQMVSSQVHGIQILPLAAVPPRIPFHTGVVYFQLDTNSDYWKILQKSSGMVVHVGVEVPGLEMGLWAIRGS